MSKLEIQVDMVLDSAYMRVSDQRVVETVELTESVMLDLDEFKMVVGVEVLSLGAEIPFQDLVNKFHVPSSTVDLLRLVQPDVATFVASTASGAASTPKKPSSRHHACAVTSSSGPPTPASGVARGA